MRELLPEHFPPLIPGQPSQEILDLHRKTVEDPDSVTDADHPHILQRLLADEDDRIFRETRELCCERESSLFTAALQIASKCFSGT